jgi:hypothetical protein
VDLSSQPREIPTTAKIPAMSPPQPPPSAEENHLRSAQQILEKEVLRPDIAPEDAESLREILYALRERNHQRVASVWRSAFDELKSKTEALQMAAGHFERAFGR